MCFSCLFCVLWLDFVFKFTSKFFLENGVLNWGCRSVARLLTGSNSEVKNEAHRRYWNCHKIIYFGDQYVMFRKLLVSRYSATKCLFYHCWVIDERHVEGKRYLEKFKIHWLRWCGDEIFAQCHLMSKKAKWALKCYF